jgi:hypothetical protein
MPSANILEELRREVEREMDMMTAVATGGPRIQEVDGQYTERRRRIRTLLRQLGLEDPNPHVDLWAWYGKWSRDFATYVQRRAYIRSLFAPLLQQIDDLEADTVGTQLPGSEETGWAAVDGQVAQLRVRLASCETGEDAQAVGLLCREIMVSLADAAHDPMVHGEVGASAVDRLNAAVDAHAAGEGNAKLRKLLKSTVDYANTVQHRRDCPLEEAGLVAEATVNAVHMVRRIVDAGL